MRLSTICLSASAAASGAAPGAWAASPFDGAWTLSETCPSTQTDVRGYAWTTAGAVRNGALSAHHRAPNEGGGSIRLQGRIGADGAAVLIAAGTVGHADTKVGHLAHDTPCRFHVEAHFSSTSGTGQRMEQGQCGFTFTRT